MRYSDTAALFQTLGGGWWNRPDERTRVGSVAQAKVIDLDLYPAPKQVTGEDLAVVKAKQAALRFGGRTQDIIRFPSEEVDLTIWGPDGSDSAFDGVAFVKCLDSRS